MNTYIDLNYQDEYPQYIPVPLVEITNIMQRTEPWQRFEKPELVDRNIAHITIAEQDKIISNR